MSTYIWNIKPFPPKWKWFNQSQLLLGPYLFQSY